MASYIYQEYLSRPTALQSLKLCSPSKSRIAVSRVRSYMAAAVEERKKRGSSPTARVGAEGKPLQEGRRRARPAQGQGYFTAGLALLFLCLTALLVFLPLVLPPLPPPPLLLLLVPVGLMAVLLALALVPTDGRGASAVASSCL